MWNPEEREGRVVSELAPASREIRAMKSFSVSAFFPEVKPAHVAWQSITIEGGTIVEAALRGLSRLRERPGIKGKHVTEVRLTIKEISPLAQSPT